MTIPETIVKLAESQIGAPYVYGTWGQLCTPALRKRYANYNPSQRDITYKRCPVLSDKQSTCTGCKYDGMMAFDCRGFTHWAFYEVDIDITGGYVKRQWTDDNWAEKGEVATMPDAVCCVFTSDFGHTGLHVGGGRVIHCSGEVKEDRITGGRDWKYYAIPKKLYSPEELAKMPRGGFSRMLKKGMSGADVTALQVKLNALGYECGTADGKFGKKTEAAVKAFQTDHGLTADGIAGPETLKLLNGEEEQQPEPPKEDQLITRAELVTIRQYIANALDLIDAVLE